MLSTYEAFPPPGYRVEFASSWQPTARAWGATLALRAADRIVRSRPDVVHIHLSFRGSFVREGLLLALAHAMGRATCATIHGSQFTTFARRSPKLARAVLRRADLILVLTDEARMVVLLLSGRHPAFMPNPVAVCSDDQVTDAPASGIALFAGEVSRRKGADVLFDAWSAVREARPGAQLVVAGPMVDVPIPTAADVKYVGVLRPDEVRQYLSCAQVAVLPSRAEALPIFALEAMASARPVIATNVGHLATLVRGAGVLVPSEDPLRLAAAIAGLLTDPLLCTSLGRTGRSTIATTYDARVVATLLARQYGRIADAQTERHWHRSRRPRPD